MLGIKPGAAGSESQYTNHCAMLHYSPLPNFASHFPLKSLFIRQKIFRGFEKYFSLITFETGLRGRRPTCTWMQNWLQNIHLIKEVRRVGWLVERKGKSERPTSKHLSKWLSRKTIRNCFSLEEVWLVTWRTVTNCDELWRTVTNCDVLWREVTTRLITILQFKDQIKIWLSQL